MDIAPKKVLVAEDDEIVLVLITHVLTRQSYTVHRSATVAEMETLLADEIYDAILVAPRIANGDGDFLARVTERHPGLKRKLIILAGSGDDAAASKDLGVCAVMRKPVEIYELIDTVHRCIHGDGN